jgi:glycosyltransferase involved in cell wall biosynthesis
MRTVLEYQDAFSSITRRRAENASFLTRLPLRVEADRIGRFERQAQGWFDASCIISEQDRDRLPVPDPSAVQVLRNGVDTEHFSSPDVKPLDVTADICFVGNMGYRPNVRAAAVLVDEIQPRLTALRGRTTILLSGARPARSVRRLAGPDVTVTGWVDDVRRPYLSGSVMVAPLFTGGGQQNKVLEAMAVGVPCVTSGVVNNAIGAEPGTEIVIADDAAEFAARTADLLADPESRRRIGSAGQRFVRDRYGWRATADRLERILEGP